MNPVLFLFTFALGFTSSYAGTYPGHGYFPNHNPMFACTEGGLLGLEQALREIPGTDLKDYYLKGSVSFSSKTNGRGERYTATDCDTVLSTNGPLEELSNRRGLASKRYEETVRITGNDATVDQACRRVELKLLEKAQYAGLKFKQPSTEIGWEGSDARPYASRFIRLEHDSGKIWGTQTPYAECTITRDFQYVEMFSSGVLTGSAQGPHAEDACQSAIDHMLARASEACASIGLELYSHWQGSKQSSQSRGEGVTCNTYIDYSCMEKQSDGKEPLN